MWQNQVHSCFYALPPLLNCRDIMSLISSLPTNTHTPLLAWAGGIPSPGLQGCEVHGPTTTACVYISTLPPPPSSPRDIKWLVESMASSRGETGRRWLAWLNDGLSLPFSGTLTLAGLIAVLRPLMTSNASGSARGRGGEEDGGVGEVLSPARLQSTIWAVQGMYVRGGRGLRGTGGEIGGVHVWNASVVLWLHLFFCLG